MLFFKCCVLVGFFAAAYMHMTSSITFFDMGISVTLNVF